ncbi:transporter [Oceanihabitans sediminis]|uniref:Transporter n=1 Tax=Oceanihabitans sediminis TaxID=1812012 RepID=A0A368P7X2_9FLAO|nr:transporter [Oceanihabitans sediminis]MDX1278760.1 transporter [Oceanihabitans sediminis]MDX1773707.1 transporter [Oceanihabitans sediminis]RBP33152.1 outer membrane putative beta-barrel porin/alpha-amylase [Oceanihabitans sediminis]RCU57341.1 transporter [Oceanihabitans sediminis]
MKSLKYYLVTLVFAVSFSGFSQYTEVINSNRPGVSKSAFSVGTNVIQFEAGPYMLNEKHSRLQRDDESYGVDFSLRYGLFLENLEINLEGIYQSTNRTFTNNISSEADFSNFKHFTFGLKYLVFDPYRHAKEEKPNIYSWKANHKFKWKSLIPAVSIYAGVNFDSKDNPFTAPGVQGISPKVMIATQNNFVGGWVYVMNFMQDRIGSTQSDFSYILTLTKAINQQWAVFGEAHGIKSDFYADNLVRFGGAYLWSKNFQLDTAVTLNTKDTPSVFGITLGASFRLDFHEDQLIDNTPKPGKKIRTKTKKETKKSKQEKQQQNFDDF